MTHYMESTYPMSHIYLKALRENNPAWRLLASPLAPYIAAFFHQIFIIQKQREVNESELISHLQDFMQAVNQDSEETPFKRSALDYLNDWTDNQHGWLRKFFPTGKDQAHFDITPEAQKAIEWLDGLKQQAFIGTESRLLTVFNLLHQIAMGAETDPQQRLADLYKQKDEIEQTIKRVEQGEIAVLSDTQIKERFWQAMATAKEILSDFRAVEYNFRELDKSLRERIAVWNSGKGALLSNLFDEQDDIVQSEQGKSFAAFWQFLMSSSSQNDFFITLDKVLALNAVSEMGLERESRSIHHDWVRAGAHVQDTIALLSQQLRHYVSENYFEEERRITQIMRKIERKALAVSDNPPKSNQWKLTINSITPNIQLPFDRPLYTPRIKPEVDDDAITVGAEDFPTDILFSQVYVDKEKLKSQISTLLQTLPQVTLKTVVTHFPLEVGLSEIVFYLTIADEAANAVFHTHKTEEITWLDGEGRTRMAHIPLVNFTRFPTEGASHESVK
ncbi:MAG: DUF3375 domain-containing protein [Defluviitaleaceae bacterium]|nr:DUF3375 domain-containing protein [Defluviitaleaceae bacterium]MCL2273867.1 DUF3375 domain-containing protein [Defluviitaleaceae bacterium]